MKRAEWNAANHAYVVACNVHEDAMEDYGIALKAFRTARVADYAAFDAAQKVMAEADAVFGKAFLAASELCQESELEDYEVNDQLTFLEI